jgi:hypothetical protein
MIILYVAFPKLMYFVYSIMVSPYEIKMGGCYKSTFTGPTMIIFASG